jgi:hypothetical protein
MSDAICEVEERNNVSEARLGTRLDWIKRKTAQQHFLHAVSGSNESLPPTRNMRERIGARVKKRFYFYTSASRFIKI